MDFRLWHLADIFLKTKKGRQLLQGREPRTFFFNNKISSFGWKLEFWKLSIYHQELDSFPTLKDLSDDSTGDINECNDSDTQLNMPTSESSAGFNLLIFCKGQVYDATKSCVTKGIYSNARCTNGF